MAARETMFSFLSDRHNWWTTGARHVKYRMDGLGTLSQLASKFVSLMKNVISKTEARLTA
jgi:hypothetical protein